MKIAHYIKSFRLRTLPLSVSGIIIGSFLSYDAATFSITVFLLAMLTTLWLQIMANLANELGDSLRGTDDEHRQGPQYALQSGLITTKELKRLLIIVGVLAILSGVGLIFSAFGTLWSPPALIMLLIGGIAIIAAITYTLGSYPYGYHALGDFFVFLFFGLASTLGACYLQTHHLSWAAFGAATATGLLSVAVLNLNNMRDIDNDRVHHKHTVAQKLGLSRAKWYHAGLVTGALILFVVIGYYQTLLLFPVFLYHIIMVFQKSGKELDRQFPVLSFSTLLMALIIFMVEIF